MHPSAAFMPDEGISPDPAYNVDDFHRRSCDLNRGADLASDAVAALKNRNTPGYLIRAKILEKIESGRVQFRALLHSLAERNGGIATDAVGWLFRSNLVTWKPCRERAALLARSPFGHPALKLTFPRGAGYWLLKPYIISDARRSAPVGATLLYSDVAVAHRRPHTCAQGNRLCHFV